MTDPAFFSAPWDQKLAWLTVVFSAIVLGSIAAVGWFALTRAPSSSVRSLMLLSGAVTLAIFMAAALLAPRGYTIRDDALVIERWAGTITIPLASIQAVERIPGARLSGSFRTLGSGGLFGYYGRFRNKSLGAYRMYATRGDGYVLVRAGLPYVLTPDAPDRFMATLEQARARPSRAG